MSAGENRAKRSSNTKTPDEWAETFDDLLQKERKIVFQIGEALIAAEAELSKKDFIEAIKRSGLKTKTTALNYMRVAQSENFRRPDVQKFLPTGVGALIDLAAWTPKEIDTAIAKKVLHPQSERKALKDWVVSKRMELTEPRPDPSKSVHSPPDGVVVGYVIASGDDMGATDRLRIEDAIRRLGKSFPQFNFYVSESKERDSITFHRLYSLSERIVAAYLKHPGLFMDPEAKRAIHKTDGSVFRLIYDVKHVGRLLGSSAHKELHKILKFTKAEWDFLGVDKPGYSTLLPLLYDEEVEKSTKKN